MEIIITKPSYRVVDGLIGGAIGAIIMGIIEILGTISLYKGIIYSFTHKGFAFQPFTSVVEDSGENFFRGLVIHLGMSMLAGMFFVPFANRMVNQKDSFWLWGAFYAGLIWVIDQMGALKALNPTMDAYMNQLVFFMGHLVFGATLGTYVSRQSYQS